MRGLTVLGLIALLFIGCSTKGSEGEGSRAVFCWEGTPQESILEKYNIGKIYLATEALKVNGNGEMRLDADRIEETSRPSYLLAGSPEWQSPEMIRAAELAEKSGKFAGVIFDVEPEVYDADFAKEVEITCQAGQFPRIYTIPYWIDRDVAERIVKAADEIVLMAYWVEKDDGEYQQRELSQPIIDLCQKYDTPLTIAFELQPPSKKVSEKITFNEDAEEAEAVFEQEFENLDVSLAYHAYKNLK